MSAHIPVQEVIGTIKHSDCLRSEIGELDPKVAGELANQLRAGIITGSIKKINPEDHPAIIDAILLVLGWFEARAKQ
jgi:hypothetical protein